MTVSDTDPEGRPLGRLKFLVTSRSGEEPYQVDLGAYRVADYGCNSKCDCPDFQRNRWPTIRDDRRLGMFKPSDNTRCAHIIYARQHMAEWLRSQIPNQPKTHWRKFEFALDQFLEGVVKQFPDYETEQWD